MRTSLWVQDFKGVFTTKNATRLKKITDIQLLCECKKKKALEQHGPELLSPTSKSH